MRNLRQKRAGGSVMVELALIFVMFASILIGIIDFGQFLFQQQALVERVRVAARWGAVNDPSNAAAITNVVLYAQSTAPPGAAGAFGLTPSMVQVATLDAGTDNYRLVVQLSGYSYRLLSPYIGGTFAGPPITVSVPLGLYN